MGQITRLMMTEIANFSDIPRIQDCWFSPHQISLMSQHSEPENLHSEYLVRWLPAPSSQSEPLLLLFASQAEMLPKYRSSRITRSGRVLEWDCRSSWLDSQGEISQEVGIVKEYFSDIFEYLDSLHTDQIKYIKETSDFYSDAICSKQPKFEFE